MNQAELNFARTARDEGIRRSESRANEAIPGWSDLAFQFIQLYAQRNRGKQFIGRDVVLAAKAYGLMEPTSPKAWGGPMQRAARAGVLKKVGTAPDPNRHCNPVPLWEAA